MRFYGKINKEMKRIGIFGGTFDPVHVEHVNVAKIAIEKLGLDKLYLMPTFSPPHKENAVASQTDRFNMLKLAFSDVEKVEISDYEIKAQGKSYTYLTVEHFNKELAPCQLFFIVGLDMLHDFKNWKYPERILSACTLVAFGREGLDDDYQKLQSEFYQRFNKNFELINYTGKRYSSTKIRVYSSLGLDLLDMTCESVKEYIEKKGIYKNFAYAEFLINNLTKKRLIHTANVCSVAMEKCKELGLSRQKVLTACMLHDCAKYLNPEDFKDFKLPDDMVKPVVHAFLGAFVAEKVLGVDDPEIIDAIRYHTSGKENMSDLAKLVFVADMIEEGRSYQGVEELREYYKKDLDTCFKKCLMEEVIHLKNKQEPIYNQTFKAYNYYCK